MIALTSLVACRATNVPPGATGEADLAASTLTATRDAAPADGRALVDLTFQARNADGDALAREGLPVVFEATLGTLRADGASGAQARGADAPTTVRARTDAEGRARARWSAGRYGNGEVRARFAERDASTDPVTATAAFYGTTPDEVALDGPDGDAESATGVTNPPASVRLREDGTVRAVVEVQLRDADGAAVRAGGVPVTFASADGTLVTPVVVTDEDGVARTTFTMPGGAGDVARITAHLGPDANAPRIGTTRIAFEATLVATDDGPYALPQGGTRTLSIEDDLLDDDAATDGVPLRFLPEAVTTTGVDVTLDGDALTVTARAEVGGTARFAYAVADDQDRRADATVAFDVVPDLQRSIVTASDAILAGDGEAATEIRVLLRDARGAPLGVGDLPVTLTTDAGFLPTPALRTDATGRAATTLVADDAYPVDATVRALLGGDEAQEIGRVVVRFSAPLRANDDGPYAVVQGADRTLDVATLFANDASDDPNADLAFAGLSATDGVTVVTPTEDRLRVTPTAPAGTRASFTYLVEDEHGLRAAADVAIDVTADPTTSTFSVTDLAIAPETGTTDLVARLSDADGDTIERAGLPVTFATSHGTFAPGPATYTTATDATGVATATLVASDDPDTLANVSAHVGTTASDATRISTVDVAFWRPVVANDVTLSGSDALDEDTTGNRLAIADLLADDVGADGATPSPADVTVLSDTAHALSVTRDGDDVEVDVGRFADRRGQGTFAYRLRDPDEPSNTDTATVTIDVNLAPRDAIVFPNDATWDAFRDEGGYTPPTFTEVFDTWPVFGAPLNGVHQIWSTTDDAEGRDAKSWTASSSDLFGGDFIQNTWNTGHPSGFFSPEADHHETLRLEATLWSDASDNDEIGLIVALAETDATNFRYLVATRSPGRISGTWSLDEGWALVDVSVTDGEFSRTIVAETDVPGDPDSTGWGDPSGSDLADGYQTRVRVERAGDQVTVRATPFSATEARMTTENATYPDGATITLDLDTGDWTAGSTEGTYGSDLDAYAGPKPYGYMTYSQPNTTFLAVDAAGGVDTSTAYVLADPSETDAWTGSTRYDFGDEGDAWVSDTDDGAALRTAFGWPRKLTAVDPSSPTDHVYRTEEGGIRRISPTD
ncbi:MAG: hypothetical protein RI554_10820 [Trueperaceae bacterium]|nr:hypothetical protein [Trueperaceae bacterium]